MSYTAVVLVAAACDRKLQGVEIDQADGTDRREQLLPRPRTSRPAAGQHPTRSVRRRVGAGVMTSTPAEHSNWTSPGSDASAQRTYASVKKALEGLASRRDIEIFLQGSYANATNVRADSDVDIVVMAIQTFTGSFERLGPTARAAWDRLPQASFTVSDLRIEVEEALTSYYGTERVHPRNKCIQVDKGSGTVDADVVPCIQYRWYPSPTSDVRYDFIEGIKIHPLRGASIVNFPKVHIRNGQDKNKDCGGNYKQAVRQVKRLRTRAVAEGRLAEGVAPGYLLECMVYNAPRTKFVSNDSQRLLEVVSWLKSADKTGFRSCDEIHYLFKDDPGDFSVERGQRIADALWDAY